MLLHTRSLTAANLTLSVLLLLGGSCGRQEPTLLDYDSYLRTYPVRAPLPMLDATTLPQQQTCTPLLDDPPYTRTIDAALVMIREAAGARFVKEAMRGLPDGIVVAPPDPNVKREDSPYSGKYYRGRITLASRLFAYGCVEDVAGTLIHEMVHAIQLFRWMRPGGQLGEHSLNGWNHDAILAELEAETYQFYIVGALGLANREHLENMVTVSNDRRRQFNADPEPSPR